MRNFIVRNPKPTEIIPSELQSSIIERKKLILKMMSNRSAVRVICAPSLFGKSVLALQYAKIIFAAQSTIWVHSNDPRFLRDLDAGVMLQTLFSMLEDGLVNEAKDAPECELFVFDAVPNLSYERKDLFKRVLTSLHSLGYEVVVTTRYSSLFGQRDKQAIAEDIWTDGARTDDTRADGIGADGTRTDGIGADGTRGDGIGADGTREKVVRVEGVRAEAARVEAVKEKGVRTEVVRAEATGEDNYRADDAIETEQVATTDIFTKDIFSTELSFVLINAQELLLSTKELLRLFPHENPTLKGWVCPPTICDKANGHTRMFSYFQSMEIQSIEDALALTALLLSEGKQLTLHCFIKDFSAIDLEKFNEYYAYAGVRNRIFVSYELSAQERFSLLWTHVKKLVKHSLYPSEKDYFDALLDELFKAEDYQVIQLILKFCLEESEREKFCARNNTTMNFIMKSKKRKKRPLRKYQLIEEEAQLTGNQSQLAENQPQLTENQPHKSLRDPSYLGYAEGQPFEITSAVLETTEPGKDEYLVRRSKPLMALDPSLNAPENSLETLDLMSSSTEIFSESEFRDNYFESGSGNRHPKSTFYENGNSKSLQTRNQFSVVHDSDRLVINLFGKFEVRRGGKSVPEKGEIRKLAKVLIGLLVVNYQKDLPRAWVEQRLWPGSISNSISSNFYNLWAYVKKTLSRNEEERMLLGRTRDSVSLRELQIESDVIKVDLLCNEFSVAHDPEDCARILSQLELIYQGPLLPGLDNAQIEAYRNRFQNKVLDVVVEGTRIIFNKGNKYVALHFAAYSFGLDITREDACYTYMFIQRQVGHYSGAIDTYLECRGALVEEYGIDAPRRLDDLYGEIIAEISQQ